MKVYQCSLKDYIGFINGNLKEATQFKDANDLLEKTCNGTIVGSKIDQKLKIAIDIANGMNRKFPSYLDPLDIQLKHSIL